MSQSLVIAGREAVDGIRRAGVAATVTMQLLYVLRYG